MSAPLTVETAHVHELESAFALIFQHLPDEERQTRITRAISLIVQGQLEREGVLVVRDGERLLGAIVCMPLPGAGGLVWPPAVAAPGQVDIQDRLVQAAKAWLRARGAKLAQGLFGPTEVELADPLERNGFRHVTSLLYLRHPLEELPAADTASAHLSDGNIAYEAYCERNRCVFHDTLLHSYDGTRDCPELNGVRTIDDIIDGHKQQGVYDPQRWWLVHAAGQPVGVVVVNEVPAWLAWDLAYIGLVPEARGKGLGRLMTRRVLEHAHAARAGQVTLAVDTRNTPACRLYAGLGFIPFNQCEVYLAFW